MFILNQDGDCCEEIKSVSVKLSYTPQVLAAAIQRRENIMEKVYNYGSTSAALLAADKAEQDFLKYQPTISLIFINEKKFATYDHKDKGDYVFKKIIEDLRNKEHFLDLSTLQIPMEALL